ncbi:hypothetical protein PAECIP111892_02127 [Paenibacillus auburnensis]|uniref:Uncharacterized protein n=1 Tax=Paenibacillus auburnensis TaxID=2905649 RepID=A0ABN8G085_9BACL|nr:hypothetical protein [Paenibacillus auburnensis]CAH1195917.1 hypothetical protein PAECIP111892_02127 [Paenibacillus auburnensis]
MLHNQEFKVYIITTGDIMRFFVIEIIIGTVTYALANKIFHNFILASAGGWVGTETIKWVNAAVKMLVK